jgi:hypothetical protein
MARRDHFAEGIGWKWVAIHFVVVEQSFEEAEAVVLAGSSARMK